jgi:hypothetical protein
MAGHLSYGGWPALESAIGWLHMCTLQFTKYDWRDRSLPSNHRPCDLQVPLLLPDLHNRLMCALLTAAS